MMFWQRPSVPHRHWRLFVADIIDAVEAVEQFTSGLTEEAFFNDRMRLDAVLKNLSVIGEAAGRMPPGTCAAHPEIPWSKMRAMRNVVVHDYFGLNQRALWGTVTVDLEPLLVPLRALLHKADPAG